MDGEYSLLWNQIKDNSKVLSVEGQATVPAGPQGVRREQQLCLLKRQAQEYRKQKSINLTEPRNILTEDYETCLLSGSSEYRIFHGCAIWSIVLALVSIFCVLDKSHPKQVPWILKAECVWRSPSFQGEGVSRTLRSRRSHLQFPL